MYCSFISYTALHAYLNKLLNYVDSSANPTELSNPFLYNNGCWRHAESAKLLQLLGYGNFVQQFKNFSGNKPYSLFHVENAPALSVSPHRISTFSGFDIRVLNFGISTIFNFLV